MSATVLLDEVARVLRAANLDTPPVTFEVDDAPGHPTVTILVGGGGETSYRCAKPDCRALETPERRTRREAREAEQRSRREALNERVDFTCACGVVLRLPRRNASGRVWCCQPCARRVAYRERAGRPTEPCEACRGRP